jgi:urocanate hydratase
MEEGAADPQADALRAFTVLTSLRADWAGSLVLAIGLGRRGSAVSTAANIARAACLAIDERAEACRAALLSGACDFVVNTVDEALRILKNQIRQRRPVSVGLEASQDAAVGELLERGVLPELFTVVDSGATRGLGAEMRERAVTSFGGLGAMVVDFDGSLSAVEGVVDAAGELEAGTRRGGMRMEAFSFASGAESRAFDARLLQIVPTTDPRHRWCIAAPRFFHRQRPHRRVVYLTAEERKLAATLQQP